MLKNDGMTNLVPVVHGYDLRSLRRACEEILQFEEPTVVGLGSLVPLIMRSAIPANLRKRWQSTDQFVASAIETVRSCFPHSVLHVFGVGSLRTLRAAFSAGADSADTLAWRVKSANGAIVLPGIGDKFVTPRGQRVGEAGARGVPVPGLPREITPAAPLAA